MCLMKSKIKRLLDTPVKKAYHCDGVDILVVTSKKIMHKLFILGNEQNGYYLAESSQDDFFETVNRVSNNKYEEKISVMEDSCFMNMRISWDEMGIDPLKDKVVPFNVAGLMTSPKTMENTGNYQLFDNKNDLLISVIFRFFILNDRTRGILVIKVVSFDIGGTLIKTKGKVSFAMK